MYIKMRQMMNIIMRKQLFILIGFRLEIILILGIIIIKEVMFGGSLIVL